jgi:hypothetical protein
MQNARATEKISDLGETERLELTPQKWRGRPRDHAAAQPKTYSLPATRPGVAAPMSVGRTLPGPRCAAEARHALTISGCKLRSGNGAL